MSGLTDEVRFLQYLDNRESPTVADSDAYMNRKIS